MISLFLDTCSQVIRIGILFDDKLVDYLEFQNDNNVNLEIDVRNVERSYLKIVTNRNFYDLNGNQEIDINSLNENVYLIPNEKKVLYGLDKKTKFEFIYR